MDIEKRQPNDYPWIEITKSVKSSFTKPVETASGSRFMAHLRNKSAGQPLGLDNDIADQGLHQGIVDDEYDLSDIKSTTMKIRSLYIMNALRAVITYYPAINLRSETLTLRAPFEPLIQFWDELKAYKDKHPATHDEKYQRECNEHIDTVLTFAEQDLDRSVDREKALHNGPEPKATFENLWMLLRPGEIVFAKIDDQLVPGVVDDCVPLKTPNGAITEYAVHLW